MTKKKEESVLRLRPNPALMKPDQLKKKAKKGVYATPRPAGAVLSPDDDIRARPVYVPRRESPLRIGSEDFLTCPSRTNLKRYYPLTKETK